MHEVWHLRPFTAEIADSIRSFHTTAYQGQIQAQFSGSDSFEAMERSTPGNWFILTGENIWIFKTLVDSSSDGLRRGRFRAPLDVPTASSRVRYG
jgi:hypothetical protein